MNTYLIHGDHVVKSNSKLISFINLFRKKNIDIQFIDDYLPNIKEIVLNLSLFSENKLIIIKNNKYLNKSFLSWLNKCIELKNVYVLMFYETTISPKKLKKFPKNTKIMEFKLPRYIWNFLNSFFPGNLKNTYRFFLETLKYEPIEIIFSMLSRHLRDIYWAKFEPESMYYPSWRIAKLKNLAIKYNKDTLESLINDMILADINSKTSKAELSNSLDFIMIKYLE